MVNHLRIKKKSEWQFHWISIAAQQDERIIQFCSFSTIYYQQIQPFRLADWICFFSQQHSVAVSLDGCSHKWCLVGLRIPGTKLTSSNGGERFLPGKTVHFKFNSIESRIENGLPIWKSNLFTAFLCSDVNLIDDSFLERTPAAATTDWCCAVAVTREENLLPFDWH